MANDAVRQEKQRDDLIQKINTVDPPVSPRTADVFPVVASLPLQFFGGLALRNTKHEFRWKTRSDHVTRNALAARNNAAYGQGNGRQSFRTVFRYH